jgi:hypothetical protein
MFVFDFAMIITVRISTILSNTKGKKTFLHISMIQCYSWEILKHINNDKREIKNIQIIKLFLCINCNFCF